MYTGINRTIPSDQLILIAWFSSGNYTEESLNLHEHQIRVLRGFYEDNKAIFKLVEKREMMWKRLMEFEVKCPAILEFQGNSLIRKYINSNFDPL
jgi:hypothetical protein